MYRECKLNVQGRVRESHSLPAEHHGDVPERKECKTCSLSSEKLQAWILPSVAALDLNVADA